MKKSLATKSNTSTAVMARDSNKALSPRTGNITGGEWSEGGSGHQPHSSSGQGCSGDGCAVMGGLTVTLTTVESLELSLSGILLPDAINYHICLK